MDLKFSGSGRVQEMFKNKFENVSILIIYSNCI